MSPMVFKYVILYLSGGIYPKKLLKVENTTTASLQKDSRLGRILSQFLLYASFNFTLSHSVSGWKPSQFPSRSLSMYKYPPPSTRALKLWEKGGKYSVNFFFTPMLFSGHPSPLTNLLGRPEDVLFFWIKCSATVLCTKPKHLLKPITPQVSLLLWILSTAAKCLLNKCE